jgi:ABC-type multidrug transport system ATPase subunit
VLDDGITVLVSTHYMDEAGRCDELCYIAYGHVLAFGSAAQIVAEAGASDLEDAFVRLVGRVPDNFS